MDAYDVIVIGGGAAGCMAAVSAARLSRKVLIIEKNDKLAKKIYATGNGKCNFTNEVQRSEYYRSCQPELAWKIVNRFNKDMTLEFFKGIGILPKNKNGCYYPNSEQASSAAEAFSTEIKRLDVCVEYNTIVIDVMKNNNSNTKNGSKTGRSNFVIETDNGKYFGNTVVITAGGMASPAHGSDGSGYRLAENIGHKLIKPLPALTQLKGRGKYFKTVNGVRLEGLGSLNVDRKKCSTEYGEFLFTAYGISGIPVLQMSRFASKAIDEGKRVQLIVDFFPDIPEEKFNKYLVEKYKSEEHKTVEEVLHGIINNKLAYAVLGELKINPIIRAEWISMQDIIKIGFRFKNFIIDITGTNEFENAQACIGGVDLMETDNVTLESLKMPGVFFAGEILDVDGTCGGYNLQWAWSSGYIAGKAAAEKISRMR